MMFLNEYEIQSASVSNIPGAKVLHRFMDMVNENSDGWPYWGSALRASAKLQSIVNNKNGKEVDILKALSPMKALCTRRNLPKFWAEGKL